MDAIKKKMQSLKTETENSLARAEQLDAEATEANKRAEKTEEHVSDDINVVKFERAFQQLETSAFLFALGEGPAEEDATC